jgi:hypothetical protein
MRPVVGMIETVNLKRRSPEFAGYTNQGQPHIYYRRELRIVVSWSTPLSLSEFFCAYARFRVKWNVVAPVFPLYR